MSSIFQTHEDYCNWDKLITHCDSINGFEEQERHRAMEAFRFLREEFGAGFLKGAYHAKHPLMHKLCNLAPWTRRWLSNFADAIRELKLANPDNFHGLSRRLMDPTKFTEAISVLETGYALFKSGFSVLFDPPIGAEPGGKVADLRIIEPISRQEMYVEVSIQYQGQQEKAAWESFDRITSFLFMLNPDLEYAGQIHRTLSKIHLDHLMKKIEDIAKRVIEESAFHEFVEEDVIDLAIAPRQETARLEQWSAARGLKPREFSGPSYEPAELVRTKIKAREEVKQLPENHPGIICLFNNQLFLRDSDIKVVVRELEEVIYDNPKISTLVVVGQWFGDRKEISERIRDHMFILRTADHGFSTEARLILSNKFARFPLSPEEWTRTIAAYEDHLGL